MCLPGLSLLVSAHFPALLVSAFFRWPCSISVTAGVQHLFIFISQVCHCPVPLAMQHYSFVSQVPPFSAGNATFLLVCLPGLSLVVSALSAFCLPLCPVLSPFSLVIVSVFPSCLVLCVRLVSLLYPFVSLLVSLLVGHCVRLVGHCVRLVSFLLPFFCFLYLRSCLSSCWSVCPLCLFSVSLSAVLSPFLLVSVSVLSPSVLFVSPLVSLFSFHLSLCLSCLPSVSFFSLLVSLFVGHCVRLVFLLFPFVSLLVSLYVSFLVGHYVHLVSLLPPFVSGLVSLLVGPCVGLVSLLFLFASFFVGHGVRLVSFLFASCLPCCLLSC